jgi:hypothetical protein
VLRDDRVNARRVRIALTTCVRFVPDPGLAHRGYHKVALTGLEGLQSQNLSCLLVHFLRGKAGGVYINDRLFARPYSEFSKLML